MPTTPTYPGVYIEEIPSGVRTITGVPTSITAFVGRTRKGPDNDPITINSYGDFERAFGGLWDQSRLGFAVRNFYQNGGSQAIIVRLVKGAGKATITFDNDTSPPEDDLVLEAASFGTWGTNLEATVTSDTRDPEDVALFNLIVTERDKDGNPVANEEHLNVSTDEDDPRYLPKVLEQRSELVRVKSIGSARPIPAASPPESASVGPIKAVAGTLNDDGDAITLAEFTGTGTSSGKRGLYALEKADLFNILCIPPYNDTNDVDPDLITAAAQYCELDRRAFFIVDPPSSWTTKQAALDGLNALGTKSKNAAVFFPRLKQRNPLRDNQLEEFAPCGAIAGIFSRTDAQRGVWKAPAGQDAGLVGVPQLSVSLTDAENGELNPKGINCLRTFPTSGRVVWGSRTLQGANALASEWKYIPVRRLALFIEESLFRGTQWVVFEPNDEPLWSQIRLNVGSFMNGLFRQGAFQGSSPTDAYLVKCDSETTTQADIDQGIVNILVGFAPLKPAEFVIIKIQQLAGQLET